jgi:hypothetical protein
MAHAEDYHAYRSVKELCAQVEEVAGILGGTDYSARKTAWADHIQGSRNIFWKLGRAACGPGRSPEDAKACIEAIGMFLGKKREEEPSESAFGAIKKFVPPNLPDFQWRIYRLLTQLCIIELAAVMTRDGGETAPEKYVNAARDALKNAGSPFQNSDSIDSIIAIGVDRLRGEFPQPLRSAQTYFLLIGNEEPNDTAASFVMELLPGEAKSPLPDPLLGSIAVVGQEIVNLVAGAWVDARERYKKCWPSQGRPVWWIDSSKPITGLDGKSAGASIYAVVRSLLEKVPIDSAVAISATIAPSGQDLSLGKVERGYRKWKLARKAGCDKLLLHKDSEAEARQDVPSDQHAGLPELIKVETFEEAWEHLTSEAMILGAYRDQVSQAWLSQWSIPIDGENVAVLDEGTANHGGQPTDD